MEGYFDIARQADADTLFLDAGDLFQGTIISNTSDGATVVRWMNYARYDAAAVGNHEFDFGPGHGKNIIQDPTLDPLGALKDRESEAHFQMLSANICNVQEDPGQCADLHTFKTASVAKPYLIKTVKGVRLGIIGLTTPSTPDTTNPTNLTQLRFLPMKETLERYVPELETQGVDGIVVILHEGGYCDKGKCNPQDPVFKLIDALSPELRQKLPLMLAGHTHNYANTVYNGVHVLITGCYGQSFGYTTLSFDGTPGGLTVKSTQSQDFCAQVFPDTHYCNRGTGTPVAATFLGQTVTPNPAALTLLQADIQVADQVAAQVLGKTLSPLTKAQPEATLGDMMADAYRTCKDSSCTQPADIAFMNNGGIRVNEIPSGDVTYGQIFNLMPFDNLYAELSLQGSQVRDALVAWYAYGKSFPQVSGLQIVYSTANSVPRTLTNGAGETETLPDPILTLNTADGQPLNDRQTYRVILPDFLAEGGSGTAFVIKGLQPAPVIHFDRKLRDVMVDYLHANPAGLNYGSGQNRISVSTQ